MDIVTREALFILIPSIAIIIFIFLLYISKHLSYRKLYSKYKNVIDIDKEVENKVREFKNLKIKFNNFGRHYHQKFNELKSNYQSKRNVYEHLLKAISIIEEDLELTTYGIYRPHFDFDTSDKYKSSLENVREKQKQLVKAKNAIECHADWTVEGSKRKGQKMTNQYMKLMLRAFNNECDAAVLKVKWNNVSKMEARIEKSFEVINKLGATHRIEIASEYLKLKLDELRLAHEYQEKIYEEKEEQRRIREQMREEEKVQKEIEKAKTEAEKEEKTHKKALEQAKIALEKAKGEEIEKLNSEIALLQEQLKSDCEKKERAISRAQMTKAGHIYVVSNIGSFGKSVYKIGMTRRLEPMDRVKELGDASVPFSFDVHAMIYSENAPDLESILHNEFDKNRLNLINKRKEFFKVGLNEIEKIVTNRHSKFEFTKIAEAKEYHESLAIIEEENNRKTLRETVEEKFPSEL